MARKKRAEGEVTAPRVKRYAVDFDYYEQAMLTEANLSYQVYQRDHGTLPLDRRQKICGMLKRFIIELKPELDAHKEKVRAYQALPAEKNPRMEQTAQDLHDNSFSNGD